MSRPADASRPRVAVVFGGRSTEHGISCVTASGVLASIEKHIPEAEVTLLPMDVRNGVEEMLLRRFPKLHVVRDKQAAYDSGDFLLHGSGPYLTAHRDVAAWRQETGKPYGRGGGGE